MRRSRHVDDGRLDELLDRLGEDAGSIDDDALRAIAQAATEAPRELYASTARSRRPALVWTVVPVAVALLVGSGFGFGLGSSVTPNGTARTSVAGLGFIPADGWNVIQIGAIGESGVARAIAANMSIDPEDGARDLPTATLRRLGAGGVVIVARFSPRGDALEDARFPVRSFPLRFADAQPMGLMRSLSPAPLQAVRLLAAAGGYNVEARVFMSPPASPGAIDEQLRRLVVRPAQLTLFVFPRVIADWNQRMTIRGSLSSGRANEKVTVQFKACGLLPVQFRDAFETTTRPGGGYSFDQYLQPLNQRVSGVYRAVSGDSLSAETPVSQRALVGLRPLRSGRFEATVTGKAPFWRRYVLLQGYQRGRWVTVRRLLLTEQWAGVGDAITVVTAPFRPPVPRGTRIRVVFPRSQAGPCYLAGLSQVRRT